MSLSGIVPLLLTTTSKISSWPTLTIGNALTSTVMGIGPDGCCGRELCFGNAFKAALLDVGKAGSGDTGGKTGGDGEVGLGNKLGPLADGIAAAGDCAGGVASDGPVNGAGTTDGAASGAGMSPSSFVRKLVLAKT